MDSQYLNSSLPCTSIVGISTRTSLLPWHGLVLCLDLTLSVISPSTTSVTLTLQNWDEEELRGHSSISWSCIVFFCSVHLVQNFEPTLWNSNISELQTLTFSTPQISNIFGPPTFWQTPTGIHGFRNQVEFASSKGRFCLLYFQVLTYIH